ncbi:GntR family transcriptional regulator [Cryobacterium sp. TMT1-21]|uniref:GntR family transcriptional regulator n=1 Tax=Cryobacterium shii TaxID=1259235 RepID=A0AAQ2C5S6_9MICO|nr:MULTISPECIES: GntR family transcriptional regulator [Cryobacterium]TFC46169.1 GntR family transcriptional regulator [Cryobacterium shii]TFC81629.1 GntR family transcriptional regulator [Cryobacterium sp. TmT2-59]TFD12506.1 GntR family transcriptional regulator [Cryobacterium sp. TMT4-10]TFD13303.1 GntR family transcriptional regulator [Cryobacterium sp. TMT1-21]TFD16712.1 GntR family transcriptional regulator [Cryobacterium sp. TMT2-23]
MDRRTEAALAGPLESTGGIPLRVAVYSRITEAIRSGTLPIASLLPSETELGTAMGVSRTVVREALMLLEEDRFVRSRRGIGRFVADRLPHLGLQKIRPIEVLLGETGPAVQVRRTQTALQTTSPAFTADAIGIRPDQPSWFIESVISRDGAPIALLQEHVPGEGLTQLGAAAVNAVSAGGSAGTPVSSALAALIAVLGPTFGPGETDLAIGVPGATRGRLLGLPAASPVLILTQALEHDGAPFYLSKTLINTVSVQLTISHAAQS